MFEFDKLCREIEQLDSVVYMAMISERSARILPALASLYGSAESAVDVYATFLMGSVCADGKLNEDEYLLMLPAMKECFGENFDYVDAKALLKKYQSESKELKKLVNDMVDVFGLVSEELKADIVVVSLLICAIDGKISAKEKRYIRQLIR